MKKSIFILSVATLLMAGCDKEMAVEQTPVAEDNQICIEASLGSGTRATATAFEDGDTIGLYAVEYNGDEALSLQLGGNYLNNEAVTKVDGVWTPARPIYWSENPCDFYGIYPYQQLKGVKDITFDLPLDQQAEGGYEAADLLWAKTERVSREDGTVNLQFKHMMSRLVVEIERGPNFEGELPEDIVVHIYNTATTASVDWTIGSLEKHINSENKTINMRKVDGSTFEAIVIPQFIERVTPLVEITMEGIAYLLEESISLRPGYQHTITATLNTSPDQEKIEIDFDGSIEDGEW